MKIFLSYAREDQDRVLDLYRKLKEDGYDAWIDGDKLLPGQDWDLEIKNAIKSSDVVILCLTKISVNKRGYVQREMKQALDLFQEKLEGDIFIIPARLDECNPPETLSKWQYVDLFSEDGHQKLLKALELKSSQFQTLTTEAGERNTSKIELVRLQQVAEQLFDHANQALQENQEALTPALQGLETTKQAVEKMVGIFHRQRSRGFFTRHEAYLHEILQKHDSDNSELLKITEELRKIVDDLIEIFYSYAEEYDGRLISKSNILRKEILLDLDSIESLSFFERYLEGIRSRVERISRIIGKLFAMNE
jgi:hypothetical protein